MFTSDNSRFNYQHAEWDGEAAAAHAHPICEERGCSWPDRRDIPNKASSRIARHYLIAAAGCALFAAIYAQFSHGVHSPFMTFMFAIPLVGGALPALVLKAAKVQPLPRMTRQSWALAIACLTVASCLRGVFDIAGTASPLLVVYVIATIALLTMAAIGLLRE